MANFTTSQDLVNGILQHSGEVQSTTTPSSLRAQALTYLNRAQHALISGSDEFNLDVGDPWPWAKAQNPGVLQLDPPYETGTVTLTKGSIAGTLTDPPAFSLKDRWLKIADRPDYMRIATHTAAMAAFVLDANYTGDSDSGLDFKAHRLDYNLASGIQRLIEPMRTYRNQSFGRTSNSKIQGIASEELSRRFPLRFLLGAVPDRFSIIGEIDGQLTVRFNTSVNEETRVEYEYVPIPSDLTDSGGSTPLVPREFRIALVYMASYWLLLDKDDNKSAEYRTLATAKLQAMVKQRRKELAQTSRDFGRLVPRGDLSIDRNQLRTASGLLIR